MTKLQIRAATATDRDFLIEAIIEAEKSGTEIISYCNVFGLDLGELRSLLEKILDEDFGGQELCISGFLVAEIDGRYAGAASAWIESESDMPSTIIKANLLHNFLGRQRLIEARKHFAVLARLSFDREPGSIQLESVFVHPDFRGQCVAGSLLGEHISLLRNRQPSLAKAQIILTANNRSALRAYEKLGFKIKDERSVPVADLSNLVPFNSKFLLEKTFAQAQH